MSRKRKAPIRNVYPDPKYHSEVVSKFINSIMYDGKRSTAEKILYDALDIIKKKNNEDPLKVFNTWLITQVLIPMKNAFLRMPAVATFVLFMGAGYIIGGIRSAIVVGSFTLFIALTEWWDRALITMYMATFGVIVSGILE